MFVGVFYHINWQSGREKFYSSFSTWPRFGFIRRSTILQLFDISFGGNSAGNHFLFLMIIFDVH